MNLKRQPFTPKSLCEGKYVKAKMYDAEEKEYFVIYDVMNKEIFPIEFVIQYFKIEFVKKEKKNEVVKLLGKTTIQVRPKYFPQERFGKMGPIKIYEGFEIDKQFIRIETFLSMFDIIED